MRMCTVRGTAIKSSYGHFHSCGNKWRYSLTTANCSKLKLINKLKTLRVAIKMINQESARPAIIFLLSYLVEGSHAIRIGRALRERGCNVYLARYLRADGNFREDNAEDFRKLGAVLDLHGTSPKEYRRLVENFIRDNNISVIVQVGFEPMYMQLPLLKSQYPDLKIFDLLYNESGHTVSHFMFEECFDGTVVETSYMCEFIRDCSGIVDPVIHIAESGIEIERFSVRRGVESTWPLTIGYLGRMSPEKNPLGFVHIAKEIADRIPGPIFKMFGIGPQADDVISAIRRSKSQDRIFYNGYVDDIRAALAQIDILFVPSLLDGRPTTIMEANASGVPVVGTPIGGIPEMVREGVNGYLCGADDIQRQTNLVYGWSSDRTTLAELKKNARAFAENHFSHAKMVDRYMDIFT